VGSWSFRDDIFGPWVLKNKGGLVLQLRRKRSPCWVECFFSVVKTDSPSRLSLMETTKLAGVLSPSRCLFDGPTDLLLFFRQGANSVCHARKSIRPTVALTRRSHQAK
jgi:hypothetical protein